jgi:autotransporter-associated beta strand protein
MKIFTLLPVLKITDSQNEAGKSLLPSYSDKEMKPYSKFIQRITFLVFFINALIIGRPFAQTTVTYTQQVAYYYASFSTGVSSKDFNQGTFQVGMQARTEGNKQIVEWRKLRTDGSGVNTSDRSMQVGDKFVITCSATQAYGRIGFALLASPGTTSSYADRENNYAISINLDGPGDGGSFGSKWYAKSFGGAKSSASFSGNQGTFHNYTFTLTLTAPDRMNVAMTDNTSSITSNFYDVQLNTSNPITDYSIFFEDDYDNANNQFMYWGLGAVNTQHTLTNAGVLSIGQSNTSFTASGILTNGLDANSASVNSLNNALTKVGTGTLILSGANVYKGSTTISAGTLQSGADNSLPGTSAGNIILNGGAFASGGFNNGTVGSTSVTMGQLKLNANSTITLSGNSQLQFAASGAQSWTGSTILSINGWTGTSGSSGTTGRIFIGTTNTGGTQLTVAQLAQIKFSGYAPGAVIQLSSGEIVPSGAPTSCTWLGGTSTDWNIPANWVCNSVPGSVTDVIIPSGTTYAPLINTGNALAASVTINSGAMLVMPGIYSLTISSGGSVTNNGTFTAGIGTVILSGTGIISGSSTTTFNNLICNGNTTLSSATIVNDTLQLNTSAAAVSGTSPSYSCSSLLKYNTGITMARGAEWTSATSGAGYPGRVQVSGNTSINGNNSGNNNIALCKDLTIDFGSALYMDFGTTGNSSLTVGGNTLINGSLSLGNGTGGDLYMYGNLTIGSTGVLNYITACNCPSNTGGGGRALQFIGTGTQVITLAGGGTLTVPIIDISNTGGRVQLATGTNILIPDYGTTNNSLKLLGTGVLDLNGQTLTVSGSPNGAGYYAGILASNGARTITGITGSTLAITAASFWPGVSAVSIDTAAGGTLVTDVNVLVTTNVGFAPSRFTTINGTLQLNQLGVSSTSNGFITDRNNYVFATTGANISGHCIYGNNSTLINNNGGTFSRNIEWDATGIGTIGVTPGFPNNVIISNSTIYNIGDATSTSGIADRAINGTLTIQPGSSVQMGTMDNGAHHFYIAGDVNISGTLQLATGATSTSSTAGDIYVGGNWTRNIGGVFDYNSNNPRAVTFNNSTPSIISAPAFSGETFAYAYLSKTTTSAKITLADSVTILNQLGLNEGILDLSNSNLTIVSRRNNTANIGTTVTPANVSLPYSGTGRFVIERFFPARRAWRLVTAPLNATGIQTINQAWQEGVINSSNTDGGIVNPDPGYGTLITGPYNGTAGAPFGFDPGTQPNPSLYYYNSGLWTNVPNTNATNVNAYPGFLLFLRGSRNYIIGTQYTPADTATLNPKGEINIGAQTTTASSAGFKMISNPYASAFNFSTATKSGLGNTIYEWDSQLTGTNSIGAIVTLTWNGSYYSTAPNPISPIDTLLGRVESSSAFFVNFSSAGSLTINESDKTSADALVFRPATNEVIIRSLRANLYAINADGTISLNDGVLNLFDPSYNNAVDISDATKFTTVSENIALKRDAHLLSIELRKPIAVSDSIFYNLSKLIAKNYRLQLIGTNLTQTGLTAYLQDTLLHTTKVINLNDTTNLDFNIPDAATAANSAGRFRIVFRQSSASPLPVTFTGIKAWRQRANSNNIIVQWQVINELNIAGYEIEKSTDGKNFFTAGEIKAMDNTNTNEIYTWLDSSGNNGDNFYRIKSIGISGELQYSNAVKVIISNIATGIKIYPNPVLNGLVNFELTNMPRGKYSLRITNAGGQAIVTEQLNFEGGSATKTININNNLAAGLYNLEIINPDKSKTVIPFIADKK